MNNSMSCLMPNKKKNYLIWRTYYGKSIPILGGTHKIHDKILKGLDERSKILSKYNKQHADKLTAFFKEYKSQMEDGKNLHDLMTIQLLGDTVEVPWINFKQSGSKFELYLQNLIDKEWENNATKKTKGTSMGTVYLQVGKGDKISEDYLKRILGDVYSQIVGDFASAVEKRIIEYDSKNNAYLKIETSRSGKIDNEGAGADRVNIKGTASSELKEVIEILGNASFSVKSYETKNSTSLGRTSRAKAVSAVAEYVGTTWSRGAALFYLKYPDKNKFFNESEKSLPEGALEEIEDIYNHYEHMRKIYELTGMGLSYDNIEELSLVDFLIVNRAEGEDIQVYSTKYLIKTFLETGRFKYSNQL